MKNDHSVTKYVSADAPRELTDWLRSQGCEVILVQPAVNVHTPITAHADIQMCRLGCHDNSPVFMAKTTVLNALSDDYPHDVPFNAACTGRYFIHNTEFTDPDLLAAAKQAGMTIINVKQGYAKCSTVIVDEDSIITYDNGIADACEQAGMNVLKIQPGHVVLEGYNTGFIGGTSGRVGDVVVFCGDITGHPDGVRIDEWITAKGLKVKCFDFPLTDIGSII